MSAKENIEEVPKDISDSILRAISGALKEEKIPRSKRYLKVLISTLIVSLMVAIPFSLVFGSQLSGIWIGAISFWVLCILIGFGLYFHPQPRLVVAGFWSPLVFARLILVSTVAVSAQILICPSFVFLESPFTWNPLETVTDFLMSQGGMPLCMAFCGFFFSFVSGIFGIGSIHKVLRGRWTKRLPRIAVVLLAIQLPLIWIQAASPSLREFLPFFIVGLLFGVGLSFFSAYFVEKKRPFSTSR